MAIRRSRGMRKGARRVQLGAMQLQGATTVRTALEVSTAPTVTMQRRTAHASAATLQEGTIIGGVLSRPVHLATNDAHLGDMQRRMEVARNAQLARLVDKKLPAPAHPALLGGTAVQRRSTVVERRASASIVSQGDMLTVQEERIDALHVQLESGHGSELQVAVMPPLATIRGALVSSPSRIVHMGGSTAWRMGLTKTVGILLRNDRRHVKKVTMQIIHLLLKLCHSH